MSLFSKFTNLNFWDTLSSVGLKIQDIILREGFKNKKKIVEFSTMGLTPSLSGKNFY